MNSKISNISMQSSSAIGSDDHSVVLQWSEQLQQKFGDSLSETVEISLPTKTEFVRNDLTALKTVWEALSTERKFEFSKKYGHIAYLMYIHVNDAALRALLNFWDPAYRCFTFGSTDLVPMIEEYQVMLNLPQSSMGMVYNYNPTLTASRALSDLVNVRNVDIQKLIKEKGKEDNVPIDYLLNLIRGHFNEGKGLTILALCIYGAVIFPSARGYIDGKVIKLFLSMEQGVNPVIPILAETFRSLNYCRTRAVGKLRCCVQLLYIWMHSHIICPQDFGCPKIIYNGPWTITRSPISEFGSAIWDPQHPKKMAWLNFFSGLRIEDIVWRARWMPLTEMIYKCGDFYNVPLLGPWGGIHYTPLLAARQICFKQFIPVTHGLKDQEFLYDSEELNDKKLLAINAWKSSKRVSTKRHCEGVTSEYENWQSTRKSTSRPNDLMMREPRAREENRQTQLLEEYRKLEERNLALEQENINLRNEADQWKNHASKITNDLEQVNLSARSERTYEAIDRDLRRLNKENHTLKNERARLYETLTSRDNCIKDLQKAKSYFSGLIKDLDTSIISLKSQLADIEGYNLSLHRTIDDLLLKAKDSSEDYRILQGAANSLKFQLHGCQRASTKILSENEALKKENICLKTNYEVLKNDFEITLDKVNRMVDILRTMARRADVYAEWAMELNNTVSPVQPNAQDLSDFLRTIRRDFGYLGRFH